MANGMTIDALYEAFMDIDEEGVSTGSTPFAEDVFGFFGKETLGGLGKEAWASQYGMYLPTWDPAQVHLAERERDLDYRSAMDTLKTTQAATERVYATEMDTLSTALGAELSKGRELSSKTGIRSGGLESAIQDTIVTTGSKAKDLGDRTRISKKETDDKYNSAMVDAALDFDKTERQEKEEFYDRTMAAIMRLMDTGAFDEPCEEGEMLVGGECTEMTHETTCEAIGQISCGDGTCADSIAECTLQDFTGGGTSVAGICTPDQQAQGCYQKTTEYCPDNWGNVGGWFGCPFGYGAQTMSHCYCP
jgi:hypothetical protein